MGVVRKEKLTHHTQVKLLSVGFMKSKRLPLLYFVSGTTLAWTAAMPGCQGTNAAATREPFPTSSEATTVIRQDRRDSENSYNEPLASLRAEYGSYLAELTQRGYIPEQDSMLWWGGSEAAPSLIVRELTVAYKGAKVPLRQSVIGGLSNVYRIVWKKQPAGMELVIMGGDTSDSYRAYLTFVGGECISRRVEWTSFPVHTYEETRFVSRTVEEDE
jgi:hypothetical protein